MNILFATNADYDYNKIYNLISASLYVTDIYTCNNEEEIDETIESFHVDMFIVLVQNPDDFGTIAYDKLISDEIEEERILILTDKPTGIKKSHLINQVYSNDLDQEMVNDILSYFSREGEDY